MTTTQMKERYLQLCLADVLTQDEQAEMTTLKKQLGL
jgi:hypothetical protein